jgi:hypothetical protein
MVPACMCSATRRGSQSVTYTRVCGAVTSVRTNVVTNGADAPGMGVMKGSLSSEIH